MITGGIAIDQYRAAIGLHNIYGSKHKLKQESYFWNFIYPNVIFYNFVFDHLLSQCGDIEPNPGPNCLPVSDGYERVHIGHANVRSLTAIINDPNDTNHHISKFELVRNHILHYKYNIFGISETWLDNSVQTKFSIDGYHDPIRKDFNRHQRGIMVYISKSTPAVRREDLEPANSESICVELQLRNKKVLVVNCYRVQDYDVVDFCADTDSIIDSASEEFDEIVFLGDMNARNELFWNQDLTNTEGRALYSSFNALGFVQMIHEPTRIVGNTRSCIDLIFANNPFTFSEVGTHDKIAEICDHHPIYAILNYSIQKPKSFKRWVWNFKNGDFDKFRQLLLNAPWHSCYVMNNVDDTVRNWMELFTVCAEACIPHYEATIRPGDKDFMNSNIRKNMTLRDRLRKQYKQSGNEEIGNMYRRQRNLVVTITRQAVNEQEKKVDEAMSRADVTSKEWWKVCKNKLGHTSNTLEGPLMINGILISGDREKADIFNDFFVSQSELDTSSARLPSNYASTNHKLPPLIINPIDVYRLLINLDTEKATGHDGIGNRLLKEASVPIAEPLAELFNFCLSLGHFPAEWKIAQVLPMFKKDDRLLPNNYRPISLLPCISKIFEKLLFDHIFAFLKRYGLLNKRQSGFTPGDSTINQLIAICNKLHSHIDNGDEVIGIFLDLSKAFDKVWHDGLLFKIRNIGISGSIYKILTSYLADRKQFVGINGSKSDIKSLKAGVPQGSVLGPLLFLIYINDISNDLSNGVFLFADDSSLFCPIINGSAAAAVHKINSDLDKINHWARQWLVTINAKKTFAMLFSRKTNPTQIPPLILNGTILEFVDKHKHLGIMLSTNLTWTDHIDTLINKCNKLLALLKRYKYKWSRSALETCYKSFIRPIIEYGSVLYDSCLVADSIKLEEIQLSAARTVTGAKRCTSHELLYRELGWQTLKERRYISKMCKMYLIVNNQAPLYLIEIINQYKLTGTHNTRAHHRGDFALPKCNTEQLKTSFIVCCITEWNKLNDSIKQVPDITTFKSKLTQINKRTPLPFNHNTPRSNQVIFSQIRLGFSNLNNDLFMKNCSPTSDCACGYYREDASHYFFHCERYNNQRIALINHLQNVNVKPSLALLLYGKKGITDNIMLTIFEHVYDYIQETKRFV